jgi:hypothetical protein
MTSLQEIAKQVYEKIEWHQEYLLFSDDTNLVIRIWDVLEWIVEEDIQDIIQEPYRIRAVDLLLSRRPHLSQPIPVNPTEERRPVLEYLVSIL